MKNQLALSVLALTISTAALADRHDKMPAGPIHDRYELMEGIGDNAEIIGDALKSGKLDPVAGAALKIQAAAGKAAALFPKGSTHEKSRAKPEIWEHWDKFEKLMKDLEAKAGELAVVAKANGDVGGAAKAMFGNCKSCHDDFRKPEEKEKEQKEEKEK